MKIIGIVGSPRKEQTTQFAVQTVLNSVENANSEITTDLITLHDKTIKPCVACGFCQKNFSCSITDDDFNAIGETLKDKDVKGVLVGSPVYMGSMTAQTKAFLDRTVLFRRNGFAFRNMIGAAVSVGGSRNGGQELVLQAIHAAMLIHDMIVVGDGQTTAHFGGSGWARVEGGIEQDAISKDMFENLGKRIAETVGMLK